MKDLTKALASLDVACAPEDRVTALVELTDDELAKVTGGADCWMQATSKEHGIGWYRHSGYPQTV